jgi:MoaA/NifB/PqqE/SkfB family radical SAM enzyme
MPTDRVERDARASASVIVRADRRAELTATLAGLQRQTRPPRQILIVGAGGDADHARGFAAPAPDIRLLDDAPATPAGQRNHALRFADGAFIAFLEAGATPRPDWLAAIETAFDADPELIALQGDLGAFGDPPASSASHEDADAIDTRNFAIRAQAIRRYREPFSERIVACEQEDLRWKLAADGIRPRRLAGIAVDPGAGRESLTDRYRHHYRTGIGLLQLRRLHEGFRDPRLAPARSKTAALAWLARELVTPTRPLADYPARVASRVGLLAGLTAGRKARPSPARPGTPDDLLFFVTNKCNLRCQHCFYIEELDRPTRALDAATVARIVDSLTRDLRSVSFTGGEPFLCPDLVEICEVFARRIRARDLSIASNGYYTARTVEAVERILGFANFNLYVRISLDGPRATHDALRGNPRSFDHALATLHALKALAARQPRLHVEIQTSVGARNSAELEELADFVARELGVFHLFEIARDVGMFAGNDFLLPGYGPPDKSDLLGAEAMAGVLARIRAIYDRHLEMGHVNVWQTGFQLRLLETAVEQVRQGRPILACATGDSMACIHPNLDVSICEMTQPIGNLADHDHDLGRLLRERFTPALRARRDACHCTNACNNSSTLKSLSAA